MKNKYYHRSRISEAKFREFLKYFSADLTLDQIAQFARLNRDTTNRLIALIRQRIVELNNLQYTTPSIKRQIEVDESYFDSKRVKRG